MPIYAFKCKCGQTANEFRRLGDVQPPRCGESCQMRQDFRISKAIIRPQGYSLQPGDKGYWDFGSQNDPRYRPPGQVEMFSAYYEAEADIERAAREGDDN